MVTYTVKWLLSAKKYYNLDINCIGIWNERGWDRGTQCWARVLNENYVRANLTATIGWALVASIYDNLAFAGTGLLSAVEPWSGFYEIGQPLWVATHWGQFTTAPNYNITEQTATFQLDSSFGHITQPFVFFSDLSTIDMNQTFIYKGIITLSSESFTLPLSVGVVYTFSTINGTKGAYEVPPSMPFPLPYQDDFNTYPVSSEAAYFVDQTGAWEIIDTFSTHNKVMRQMVTELPISWCKEAFYPYSVIGRAHWQQPLMDHFISECALNVSSSRGWVATVSSWNYVQFDNFYIQSSKK